MHKRSVIWVSAVLYIALGVTILTLLLSAGVPIINKIRDRNVIVQTKHVMYGIDSNIREIILSEGPGAVRDLTIDIKKGILVIDDDNEKIIWHMRTKNKMMDPDIDFKEGNLILRLNETVVVDEYIMNLELYYGSVADLTLKSEYAQDSFVGTHRMLVRHTGEYKDINGDGINDVPVIGVEVVWGFGWKNC